MNTLLEMQRQETLALRELHILRRDRDECLAGLREGTVDYDTYHDAHLAHLTMSMTLANIQASIYHTRQEIKKLEGSYEHL